MGKYPHITGIVPGLRLTVGGGGKNGADRVTAGIAGRVGVGVELAELLNVEAGFLQGLTCRRLLQGFAVVDKTAR